MKLVSSQHNRRFVWAGSRLLWILNSVCWDRGACSSNSYPKTSPAHDKIAFAGNCKQPSSNCYWDCGLQSCVCNPGFVGSICSRTGNVLSRTYLGGTPLVSQSACVCDAGRGGPACDQNPCLKLLWVWGVCISGRHRLALLMCFWLLR